MARRTGIGAALPSLGEPKRINFYVWDETNNYWEDYTRNVVSLNAKIELNTLSYFEAKLLGITGAHKTRVSANKRCCIFVGSTFFELFVIEQPKYAMDYTLEISGYSATGTVSSRELRREITGSTTYTDTAISTIVSYIADSAAIIAIDGTDTGGSSKSSIKLYYDKCIKALDKLIKITNQEWWIAYTGVEQLNKGTDTLHVATSRNNGSSQYSFATSGANRNAQWLSDNAEEVSLVNDVTVVSQAIGLTPVETNIFHATTIRSTTANPIDSFLNAAIDSDDLSVVTTTDMSSYWPDSGTDFFIKIDDEILEVDSVSTVTLTIKSRGAASSSAVPHKAGAEIIFYQNDTTTPVDKQITFDLSDASGFSSTGSNIIFIGSEKMTLTNIATNKLTVNREAGSTTAYMHGADAPVYHDTYEGTQYTKTSPQTGSSIQLNGLHSEPVVDKTATHKHELDLVGNNIINGNNTSNKKRTIIPANIFDVLDTNTVEIGDNIDATDSLLGFSSETMRIVAIDVIYKQGQVKAELDVSNAKLDYSTELKTGFDTDYQAPAKQVAETINEYSDWNGSTYEISAGRVEIEATTFMTLDANGILITNKDSTYDIILDSASDVEIGLGDYSGTNYFIGKSSRDNTIFKFYSQGYFSFHYEADSASDYSYMYHNGSDSYFTTTTGDLIFVCDGGDNFTIKLGDNDNTSFLYLLDSDNFTKAYFNDNGDLDLDGCLTSGCSTRTNHVVDRDNVYQTIGIESPEYWIEDNGIGKLINGECKIFIDKKTRGITYRDKYIVQITPYANSHIYIKELNEEYFIIGGDDDVEFSWTAKYRRKDFKCRPLNKLRYPEPTTITEDKINSAMIDKEKNKNTNEETLFNAYSKNINILKPRKIDVLKPPHKNENGKRKSKGSNK